MGSKRGDVDTVTLYTRYKSSESLRKIAKDVGMSHQAIHLRFRNAGLPMRSHSDAAHTTFLNPEVRKKITDTAKRKWDAKMQITKKQVCKKYAAGATMAQVAELAGIGVGHVRRILKDAGVTIRSARGRVVGAETRAKISASKLGKKRGPMPQAWKDKIGARARERYADPEYRKKWHEARYGNGCK